MKLHAALGPNVPIHFSVRDSFGELMRAALRDEPVVVALGPLYREDPAAEILRPFMRSALEAGYRDLDEERLAPDEVLERARIVRSAPILGTEYGPLENLVDWTRAGLVLEIARRRGLHVGGRGVLHPEWRLNATVTGRFGVETIHGKGWGFNPLSMGPEDRRRVRPSDHTRQVAVLDFKAMDVCSMGAVVPGFAEVLGDHFDPYTRISEFMAPHHMPRDQVKLKFLTWAYGGSVDPAIAGLFDQRFPDIARAKAAVAHGELPRSIQTVSSMAFRAGLSRALPLLTGIHHIPMFTVHDELVLDCSEVGLDRIKDVSMALETGASERIGRPYRVGVRTGYTYAEAKGD